MCPSSATAAAVSKTSWTRLSPRPWPSQVSPPLGADFLLRPDLGRLRPIVWHSGDIRAIMLSGVS